MKVAIIDYGAGNIKSIQFAFKRLGVNAELSKDPEFIKQADRVIFPGVGEASSAMTKLEKSGLIDVIKSLKQPVLGICLGMQLMCKSTEENNTNGLGIFDTKVIRFKDQKVPQIGWNTISELSNNLFMQIPEGSYMYFVHSFFAIENKETIAKTNYGTSYAAALCKDNFYGVQFHPEKSGDLGEQILKNFLNIKS